MGLTTPWQTVCCGGVDWDVAFLPDPVLDTSRAKCLSKFSICCPWRLPLKVWNVYSLFKGWVNLSILQPVWWKHCQWLHPAKRCCLFLQPCPVQLWPPNTVPGWKNLYSLHAHAHTHTHTHTQLQGPYFTWLHSCDLFAFQLVLWPHNSREHSSRHNVFTSRGKFSTVRFLPHWTGTVYTYIHIYVHITLSSIHF